MWVIKRKLKFDYYKHCLEATQLENEIKQLGKNRLDINSFREKSLKIDKKNNKLMLKSQQIFRSKKHIFLLKKFALSANSNKRIQSIDSLKTYAYAVNEEIKQNRE